MTNNDRDYFRFNLYNFSTQQVNYISSQATDQILNFNIVKKTSNRKLIKNFMSLLNLVLGRILKDSKLFNKHKIFDFHLMLAMGNLYRVN